jgi:hypothetical protein
MILAGRNINPATLEVDGVDSSDYPDFCDAYFSYAEFDDGTVLTDDELDELSEVYADVVNVMASEDMAGSAEDRYDYLNDR